MGNRLELAVIVAVLNQLEVTGRCLELLAQHATGEVRIVLVDNGSDPPVGRGLPISDLGMPVSVVRRERNVGVMESDRTVYWLHGRPWWDWQTGAQR